jgi:TonB family protein
MMTKIYSCIIEKLKNLLFVFAFMSLVIFLSCSKTGPVCPKETCKKAALSAYDKMPEFPGGSNAIADYICKNIKYPESARNSGKQGKVLVSFTVDRKGRVKNTTITKSVCPELDAEALRVVKMMPPWKPAKEDEVNLTLPINFKLGGAIIPQNRLDC